MRPAIDQENGLSTSFSGPAKYGDTASAFSPADTAVSLAKLLPQARFFAADDIQFSSTVSGKTETKDETWQGRLVVYPIGEADPLRVISEALARGAAGILTEQLLPCPLPQCIVPDVESAAARIEAGLLGRPDRQLLTVGVVGSAGKTTTSLLTAAVLRQAGIRTAYQTDLGHCDGVVQETSPLTPPTGAPLVQWLAEAVDSQSRAAVVELNEAGLRSGRYDAIEFDVLIVTGGESKSQDFGPAALPSALDRLTTEGVVIANADDRSTMKIIRDAGVRHLDYGLRRPADITAKLIDQTESVTTLLVSHEDVTLAMESTLCGAAMAANQLAAIAFGLLIDRPLESLVEAVSAVRKLPGRGERIQRFDAPDVVLDVASNPVQIAAALRTARSVKGTGHLWCVYALDAATSSDDAAEVGHLIERFADHAIITTDPEQKSSFLQRSHQVLDGVQSCGAFRLVADDVRAIKWTLGKARRSDTVLILTGNPGSSAKQQRETLQRLESLVNDTAPKPSDRPMLKVVGA